MTVKTALYGVLALSIAAALLTLTQSAAQTSQDRLLARVEAYWQARVQNDAQRALQYEHPEHRERFGGRLRSAIELKEFSVVSPQALQLDPSAQEAQVELNLKYEYTIPFAGGPMLVSTFVTDSWRKERGVWYHFVRNSKRS